MTNGNNARGVSDLDPTEFENLTYDSLRSVGLKNLVWRTPGADGGRDIEGHAYFVDPTGFESKQKWYVECKRYQSSIDWPTVWKKISYADSNGADVFLLSTNSNPSPACETQIALWNSERRRPLVRVWRGYEWKQLLATFPDIALSYGVGEPREPHDAVGPVTSLLTKIVQSAHMARAFGQDPDRALEAGAALSELITKRLDEIARYSRFVDQLAPFGVDGYAWLELDRESIKAAEEWDDVSLRAALTFIRYQSRADVMTLKASEKKVFGTFSRMSGPEASINSSEADLLGKWCRLHLAVSKAGEFEVRKYEQ